MGLAPNGTFYTVQLLCVFKAIGAAGLPTGNANAALNKGAEASSLDCPSSLHGQHFGFCHCECTFVDVGLNNGHSIRLWPKIVQAKLDAQRNKSLETGAVGQRLNACNKTSACYYGFEANPFFDAMLAHSESVHRRDGVRMRLFTSTAFSTHGDGVDFYVEPPNSGTGHRKSIRNEHGYHQHASLVGIVSRLRCCDSRCGMQFPGGVQRRQPSSPPCRV